MIPPREHPLRVWSAMGISAFREPVPLVSTSLEPSAEHTFVRPAHLYRNFQVCPHCENQRRALSLGPAQRKWASYLTVGRSNLSFGLRRQADLIPAERSSGKTEMKTVGFWYVRERRTDPRESESDQWNDGDRGGDPEGAAPIGCRTHASH